MRRLLLLLALVAFTTVVYAQDPAPEKEKTEEKEKEEKKDPYEELIKDAEVFWTSREINLHPKCKRIPHIESSTSILISQGVKQHGSTWIVPSSLGYKGSLRSYLIF